MEDRREKVLGIGIAATAVILTVGAGLGFYFAKSGAYQETFMPNTTINGMDVAGKDIASVKAMIEEELAGYELKIIDRTNAGEVITKEEIGLHAEFGVGLEELLTMQEPITWIRSLWTETEYKVETMLAYDEELLAARIRELSIMDKERMEKPQDAYLSDYQYDSNSYEIMPPTPGTELVEEAVYRAISEAVLNLASEVDLDQEACYTSASVKTDDPSLQMLAAELNRYAGAEVTHRFGELEEVLDGDLIHQWLIVEGTTVTLDESKIPEYVKSLAKKYNTAYEKRPFLTTYGEIVTIPGGSYGWRMNQEAEVEAILEAVKNGASRTREPEWLQKGASHGEYDYGNTYVEVNLTGQRLFFYKDGELLVECDFVSGNAARNWSTPAGIFPLTYKQRKATLRGEGYATPVEYWMPFNGNIGLHDADWRGTFGGAIYKTNGSHGCVNLPPSAAKIIYEHITAGDPVICYHLEGTETKETSKASEINTSGISSVKQDEDAENGVAEAKPEETKQEETKSAENTPAESKPAESKPAQTKPAENKPAQAAPAETQPTTPESSASETQPLGPGSTTVTPQPEIPPTETSPQVQETTPVVPEGIQQESTPEVPSGIQQETAPAIPQGALTETVPLGVGPGYSSQDFNGLPMGPGFDSDPTKYIQPEEPIGPGYPEGISPQPVGPGYGG